MISSHQRMGDTPEIFGVKCIVTSIKFIMWRLCILFKNNNLGIWYLKKLSNLRGTDIVKNQKTRPGTVIDLLTFFVCRFGHASLCSYHSLSAVYDDAFDTESPTGLELAKKWIIRALYPMRIRVLPVCASPALTFMYVVPHPEREGGGGQSTACDQPCLPSSVFETGSLLYSHIRQAY